LLTPFNPDIFNDFNKKLVNEFTAGGYVLYSPQKNTSTTFDFCRYFQEANIYGNESIGAPWGKSITPLTINELNNKSAIFCAPSPVSKLEYNILINNNSILNTSLGFHPASKNFNVSDGYV
jgi:hypothetical protein